MCSLPVMLCACQMTKEYCKSHKVSSSFILVCLVMLAIGASLLK